MTCQSMSHHNPRHTTYMVMLSRAWIGACIFSWGAMNDLDDRIWSWQSSTALNFACEGVKARSAALTPPRAPPTRPWASCPPSDCGQHEAHGTNHVLLGWHRHAPWRFDQKKLLQKTSPANCHSCLHTAMQKWFAGTHLIRHDGKSSTHETSLCLWWCLCPART